MYERAAVNNVIRYWMFRHYYFVHQVAVSRNQCAENIAITYSGSDGQVRLALVTHHTNKYKYYN